MASQTKHLTLDLLEARLRRAEYVVGGHKPETLGSHTTLTATQRLRELERALDHIVAKSIVGQDLLKLYAQYPEMFTTNIEADESDEIVSQKTPVILAAASSYPSTASGLTSILDMPVPSAEASQRIIATKSELAKLELLQEHQRREIMKLKQRSAEVLQRWYSVDVIKSGEYWADVEGRIGGIEQKVRQVTSLRVQARGVV